MTGSVVCVRHICCTLRLDESDESVALYRMDTGLLVTAGLGEAIAASAMACPVLRLEPQRSTPRGLTQFERVFRSERIA